MVNRDLLNMASLVFQQKSRIERLCSALRRLLNGMSMQRLFVAVE